MTCGTFPSSGPKTYTAFSGCTNVVSGSLFSKTSTHTGVMSPNSSNGRAWFTRCTLLYPFIRSSRGSRSYFERWIRDPVQTSESTPKQEQARIVAPTLCGNFGSISTIPGACIVTSQVRIKPGQGTSGHGRAFAHGDSNPVALTGDFIRRSIRGQSPLTG